MHRFPKPNIIFRHSTSPFRSYIQPSTIYCTENENAVFKLFDNRSNANDQTLFVTLVSIPDSLCDKLHLAKHGKLSVPDMFLLICMGYMHVILSVGKLWRRQIQVGAILLEGGERKLEPPHGIRNGAGLGGREMRAARWNLQTSIKIYRCWDSRGLQHYS